MDKNKGYERLWSHIVILGSASSLGRLIECGYPSTALSSLVRRIYLKLLQILIHFDHHNICNKEGWVMGSFISEMDFFMLFHYYCL